MRGRRKKQSRPGSNPMGRPTKINDELIKILESCFSDGLHIKTACGIARITEQTFHNWCAKFPTFLAKMTYARAVAILQLNREVKKTDPKFVMKNLEPHLYRDRIETEISGRDGEPIKLIVKDYRAPEEDDNGKTETPPETEPET